MYWGYVGMLTIRCGGMSQKYDSADNLEGGRGLGQNADTVDALEGRGERVET